MIFKQVSDDLLDDFIADIYPTIRFTMSFDFKPIQFLDLNIYVEDGYLKTALLSKPTDNHEYLNVRSWHQDSVFRSIPTTNHVMGILVIVVIVLVHLHQLITQL